MIVVIIKIILKSQHFICHNDNGVPRISNWQDEITCKNYINKRFTCEGKPWINMTGCLSALPLSTQNHLLHKIKYTEHISKSVNPANLIWISAYLRDLKPLKNHGWNILVCCISVQIRKVLSKIPQNLPKNISWGLRTNTHCKSKNGILCLLSRTSNTMSSHLGKVYDQH